MVMSIPPHHLSDEAVAAFADGVLRPPARIRAEAHISSCAECRAAVAEQRDITWQLRSMSGPATPTDLIRRLQALPVTAALPAMFGPTSLTPDGHAVFPSFRPDSPPLEPGVTQFGRSVPFGQYMAPLSQSVAPTTYGRRGTRSFGIAAAASLATFAAVSVIGVVTSPSAVVRDDPRSTPQMQVSTAMFHSAVDR